MLGVAATAHDLRGGDGAFAEVLIPDDYAASQALGAVLRAHSSDAIAYPSRRDRAGQCAALFYPDLGSNPVQGRHLDYHWNGARVDFYREVGGGDVYRIDEDGP